MISNTYIGRPPVSLNIVSRKNAGIKWKITAEILNRVRLGKNFMVGYQIADLRGYFVNVSEIWSSTWSQVNGLQVDEVQWKINVSLGLEIQIEVKKLNFM